MNMEYMDLHVLILWLNDLGAVLLVGNGIFRLMVLNPSLDILDPISPDRERAKAAGNRELKHWVVGLLILLFIVSLPDLILRAQMMTRKPFSQVPAMIPLILMQTHIGRIWIAKIAILFILGILCFFIKENSSSL